MSIGGHSKEIKIPELEREMEKYTPVKFWTKYEEQILLRYYGKVPIKKLASFLGRSYDSIRWKARSLGLVRRPEDGFYPKKKR